MPALLRAAAFAAGDSADVQACIVGAEDVDIAAPEEAATAGGVEHQQV